MNSVNTTSPVTFTIPNREFVDTLTTALGFALRDTTIPMINGVDLSLHKGQLVVTATDRFRLALIVASVTELEGPDGRLGFLSYALARKLIALVKPASRRRGAEVDQLNVTIAGNAIAGKKITVDNGSETVTLALSTIAGPDVRRLITDTIALEAGNSRDWAVNPKLLASFGAVGGPAFVRVNNQTRPLLIAINDNFIGLQMPVRMPDSTGGHDETFAKWSKFFEPVKPVRKRAPRKAPAKAAAPKKRAPAKKAARA